jgi:hypothetical protein
MRTNPTRAVKPRKRPSGDLEKLKALLDLILSEHPIRYFSKREYLTFLIPWSGQRPVAAPIARVTTQSPLMLRRFERAAGQFRLEHRIAQITVARQERGQRVIHPNASLVIADLELRLSRKAHKPTRELSDIHGCKGSSWRRLSPTYIAFARNRYAQHFRADFGSRLVYASPSRVDLRPAKRGWARI